MDVDGMKTFNAYVDLTLLFCFSDFYLNLIDL